MTQDVYMPATRTLITEEELSQLLSVSRTWLWEKREKQGLPFYRVGAVLRYDKEEVVDWFKKQGALR